MDTKKMSETVLNFKINQISPDSFKINWALPIIAELTRSARLIFST